MFWFEITSQAPKTRIFSYGPTFPEWHSRNVAKSVEVERKAKRYSSESLSTRVSAINSLASASRLDFVVDETSNSKAFADGRYPTTFAPTDEAICVAEANDCPCCSTTMSRFRGYVPPPESVKSCAGSGGLNAKRSISKNIGRTLGTTDVPVCSWIVP
jgi:hypothetical protein